MQDARESPDCQDTLILMLTVEQLHSGPSFLSTLERAPEFQAGTDSKWPRKEYYQDALVAYNEYLLLLRAIKRRLNKKKHEISLIRMLATRAL